MQQTTQPPNPALRSGVNPGLAPAGNPSPAPSSTTTESTSAGGEKLISLNFRDAPLDQVLTFYSELTGRTLIKSPGINGTITLRGQTRLTQSEALEAIESVLAMNNVTMVPMGEKFFKVVQPTAARQEGMTISRELPQKGFAETDHLISQVVTLKFIEIAEAQTIIQGFLHGYGKLQALERTNSLLITDTASNLQRIMEILDYIDQPTEVKVETRIYELKFAEAAKIAARLNEIIADTQSKEEKPRAATPGAPAASPPGVIRARVPTVGAVEQPQAAAAEAALAERGIVQGKVKIVADDRTNILIVIARPSNFTFFDKIVSILDRPVQPDIIVRVRPLEYAKAEEISSILNEFIGAAKAESKTAPTTGQGAASQAAEGAAGQAAASSQALQDYIQRRAETVERMRQQVTGEEKSRIGQLSPSTKILADKRTNSLLLMGTKGDLAALEDVIDRLDKMLSQVLIEAAIIEVNLSKNLSYGIDWLQRSMTLNSNNGQQGPNGGVVSQTPLLGFGGGQRVDSSAQTFIDGSTVTRSTPLSGNLTYFATIFDLNIDTVIHMAAGDSNARILSTPIIMTTDNTEAKINVGEQRPVVTSTSVSSAGQQTSAYEYRNIGVQLTVTPRINPQRFVVMEIAQTADDVGDIVKIDQNDVPVITKREMKASIAVDNRSTIVLGGLVSSSKNKSRAKVPILGDIPILGTLFRSDSSTDARTELLILLTPYVLNTPEEIRAETERVQHATDASKTWYRGWSDSPLANPTYASKRKQKKAEQEAQEKREQELKQGRSSESKPKDQNVNTTPRISVIVPSEFKVDEEAPANVKDATDSEQGAAPVISEEKETTSKPVVEEIKPAVDQPVRAETKPAAVEEPKPVIQPPPTPAPTPPAGDDANTPVPLTKKP